MKTIGIVALAGACEKEKIELGKSNLEKLGYNVKLATNINSQDRYLAGSDDEKLEALYQMFQDPEVDIILNARGGYGSIRLINKIDYEVIKNNPKPFIGFSDITALLLMFYKKCGMITYHGPMLCSDFANSREDFTINNFFKAINNEPLEFTGSKIYQDGSAKGILWGGNLSTVVSLCGQDFIPNEDFIFFAEDLNEPVYKIDKMFTQLFNIPKFKQNCKGIILGDFLNIDNQDWLEDLFKRFTPKRFTPNKFTPERFTPERFPLPTVAGFKITHSEEKITLPIGKQAILESNNLKIE